MALVVGTNCGFVTSAPSSDPGGTGESFVGYSFASKFTTPNVLGLTVTELGWYRSAESYPGGWQIAIYTDYSGTRPDDVVGSIQTFPDTDTGTVGWRKKQSLSIELEPNTVYWIAVSNQGGRYGNQTDRGYVSGGRLGYVADYFGTLDDPWGSTFTGSSNYVYAFYALYTATTTSTTTTSTSSSSTSSSSTCSSSTSTTTKSTVTTGTTGTTGTTATSQSSMTTQTSQSTTSSSKTTTSSTQTSSSSQSTTTTTSPYFFVDDFTFCWEAGLTSTSTTSSSTTTSTSHTTQSSTTSTSTSHTSTSTETTLSTTSSSTSTSSSCTTTTQWTSSSTTTVTFYSPDVYHWLFDIGDYHYSTQGVVYGGTTYLGRVIPDSFSGVSVKWNMGSSSLITPNEVTFDLFNGDGLIDVNNIIDATVVITYAIMSDYDSEDLRKWRFYVKYALESYGVIHVTCENYLSQFLDGDYPVTLHPKEIWPSDDADTESLDDYCVPVIFGAAYIPVMSAYTEAEDRFYVLGKGVDAEYTVERVRSPRRWPTTSWWDKEMEVNEVLRLYLGEATGGTFTLSCPEDAEKWRLNIGGATGGTFTLSNGVVTEVIDYSDDDAAIQVHLETIYGAGKAVAYDIGNSVIEITFPTGVADNIEESGLEADFDSLTNAVRPYLTQIRTYCPGGTTGNLSYEATSGNAAAIQTALEALLGEEVTVIFSGGISASTEFLPGMGEYREWTVPAGVYEVIAECWGGGGCASSSSSATPPGMDQSTGSTGGQGGGAYSKRTFSVSPGQKIDYYFAATKTTAGVGADSWFYSSGSDGCLAKGGGGGTTGGQASAGYGDVKYSGGNGHRGLVKQYVYYTEGMTSYYYSSYNGGGGGGGAGSTGDGNNAYDTTAGGSKSEYGGAGGAGKTLSSYSDTTNRSGGNGSDLGGGGGGCKNSYWSGGASGGYGGKGGIRVSYGGGAFFYISMTTNVGQSGMSANFDNLTGETGIPALTEYQAFEDEVIYDFDQSDSGDYKLCQFIIDDRNADGTADSNGLWLSGDEFLPPLVQYYRDDTYFLDNPAEVLEYILEDLGLSASDLDSTSWGTTETTLDTREVFFSGGLWEKESSEKVIANLLAQFDGFLYESDTLELHLFDSTSVETIDTSKTIAKSFKPTSKSKYSNDGGRVAWHEAETPQDILAGKAVVRLYQDQASIVKPAKEVLSCSFLTSSVSAQKAGILYFAKKYLVTGSDTFSVPITHLTTRKTLLPGMVLTIDDSMFGEEHDIVVTQLDFDREGEVKISGARMQYIEDWDELYVDSIEVRSSDSEGWKIYTADGTINFINLPTDADYDDLNSGDIYYDTADSTLKMKP